MLNFIIILVPALICTIIFRWIWRCSISNKEMLISLGVNLCVALLTFLLFVGYTHSKTSDFIIVNGHVTAKEKVKVSCEHSYSCNCVRSCSGSGTSQTCTTICQTCYEHSHDFDWMVRSTVGSFSIARTNRQGTIEPKRFTEVVIGEPAANTVSRANYLLADPESLFVESLSGTHSTPPYKTPYDYYRMNRVYGSVSGVSAKEINDYLNEKLKGSRFNLKVVFTGEDEGLFNTLMKKWRGVKINDVVLVYGVDTRGAIKWFASGSYAMNMNNSELHERLKILSVNEVFTKDLLTKQYDLIHTLYRQVNADDFEFKKESIQIPFWLIFTVFLINFGTSLGLSIYMKGVRL